MSRKNKYYPPEFKREALEMLAGGKYTMAQIERDLGISKGLMHSWKRNAERRGKYAIADGEPKNPKTAQERIRQLERELERTKQEREILKKALAIFSSRKE